MGPAPSRHKPPVHAAKMLTCMRSSSTAACGKLQMNARSPAAQVLSDVRDELPPIGTNKLRNSMGDLLSNQ
jgi:hypothetical protein